MRSGPRRTSIGRHRAQNLRWRKALNLQEFAPLSRRSLQAGSESLQGTLQIPRRGEGVLWVSSGVQLDAHSKGGATAASAALVHSLRVRRRVRAGTGPVPRARRTAHAAAASAIGVSETAAAHCSGSHAAARERTQDYAVLAAGRVHWPAALIERLISFLLYIRCTASIILFRLAPMVEFRIGLYMNELVLFFLLHFQNPLLMFSVLHLIVS